MNFTIILLMLGGGYYYLEIGAGKETGRQLNEKIRPYLGHLLSGSHPELQREPDADAQSAPSPVSPQHATQILPSPAERNVVIDWDLFGQSPRLWPKTVALARPCEFPAILNGQTVGSVTLPSGTSVKMDGTQGAFLRLEYQGAVQSVPPDATDIDQRVKLSEPH